VNINEVCKAYFGDLYDLKTNFKYEGPVLVIRCGKSLMNCDLDLFPLVFPNYVKERDLLFLEEEDHYVGRDKPEFTAGLIDEWLLAKVD
jgi:hypothetical protein